MLNKIVDGRCAYCFGKVEADAKECPYCRTVFAVEPVEVPPPPDAMTLGYTKKEAKVFRRIYDQGMLERSRGYVLWLFVAAAWLLLGFLIDMSGAAESGLIKCSIPAALMLPLFFWGNARSKKKQKIRKEKLNALDPRLVERFRWEDAELTRKYQEFKAEMAEADRLAKEARREERELEREKEKEQEHLLYD